MLELATGWQIDCDWSTEWLFVRISTSGHEIDPNPPVAESLWSIAEDHDISRMVIELDETQLLNSFLVGQFILLHKRIFLNGGVVRLCGLSAHNYDVLRYMGLGTRFPNYATREDAVMGYKPKKPR